MSSGLQAVKIEDWLLVTNDVKLRTVKHVENDTAARKVRGWIEQADHLIVTQKRHFIGLIKHGSETGEEQSSFSWYVGGGRKFTFIKTLKIGDSSLKYVCTSDRVEIDDYITGSGWQTQVWELQSKFKPVDGSYYEEDVKDEEED